MKSISEFEQTARQAMARGDVATAMAQWTALLEQDPGHGPALNALGNWHLAKGEAIEARDLFRRANAADPGQPALLFNLAAAERAAGDQLASLNALDGALAIDPYFVQAIFQKAVLLEDMGRPREAAIVYRQFLDTAPEDVRGSPRFQPLIARAEEAVARDNEALGRSMEAPAPSIRMSEARAALLGEQPVYVAEPTFLSIPRLPAIPFFDRAVTPWFEELEAATPELLAEATAVAANADDPAFVPYVDNPPGVPANQWAELDHSKLWSAFFFWKHGVRNEANAARCPRTIALLDRMPLADMQGRTPNAFFSVLAPRTRIPVHTGVSNARATVHLPLIVPPGCGFRVGAETREWVPGQAWAFDDTIQHEAWNDSDEPRLILIFDVWNPFLDAEEREFVRQMLDAHAAHHGRIGFSDTL
ncbi:aspartyl/asparaginyl beta-hydroxylase domain-containing protein [Croceibacterium sp. LX-88]|uniref:Aspartyl/asparaginyl beta-hydroxylase domain-containing protein n=1 Tax=Croceibacterium selenioxidans TaxID=2838833 RepID=A0ABS5W496_9SPHN|nr:aspartyl/asparaginyl beta-hydroxylase domain-containing protein [Croceibacterium selenioxidans]MBT2134568.1 aspartyl/asparaginyl beta-hydroxylase domain-containing protein [Croceibacterium selenioxidans]